MAYTTLQPGDVLDIRLHESDGDMQVRYDRDGIRITTEWEDDQGRSGLIYESLIPGDVTTPHGSQAIMADIESIPATAPPAPRPMSDELKSKLAAEVEKIIAHAHDMTTTTNDGVAEPLIEILRTEEIIPQGAVAYIEWQGAWEFDVASVFFGDGGCLNVGRDGSVTIYHNSGPLVQDADVTTNSESDQGSLPSFLKHEAGVLDVRCALEQAKTLAQTMGEVVYQGYPAAQGCEDVVRKLDIMLKAIKV